VSDGTPDQKNIKDLIEKFTRFGPHTNIDTINQILSRKKEALPYIAKIAQEDEYWYSQDGEYASWTPVCALHLLSVMGGKEAINAFLNSIKINFDYTGDWITEEMPSILANFGIERFDEITDMLFDNKVDPFVRAGAAKALFLISEKYPDAREKSIQALRDVISSESNDIARSCFMFDLVHFKDPGSLPFIEFYFENNMIDDSLMSMEDVYEYYYVKGSDLYSLDNILTKDPLDIFKDTPDNFYRNDNQGKYITSTKSNQVQSTPKKVPKKQAGRNDPCPCGSGKKYKKCCLKMV